MHVAVIYFSRTYKSRKNKNVSVSKYAEYDIRKNLIESKAVTKAYKKASVYIDNKVYEHLNDNGIRKPHGMKARTNISIIFCLNGIDNSCTVKQCYKLPYGIK